KRVKEASGTSRRPFSCIEIALCWQHRTRKFSVGRGMAFGYSRTVTAPKVAVIQALFHATIRTILILIATTGFNNAVQVDHTGQRSLSFTYSSSRCSPRFLLWLMF
ncbi:hypothetical protein BJX99DRAFT_235609, partial [Aspergillus californicus]